MFSALKTPLLICVNAGWIVPLYLSINAVIAWCRLEAAPVIYGTDRALNSFPFLEFAQNTLLVACVWMAAAVVFNTILCRRHSQQ